MHSTRQKCLRVMGERSGTSELRNTPTMAYLLELLEKPAGGSSPTVAAWP